MYYELLSLYEFCGQSSMRCNCYWNTYKLLLKCNKTVKCSWILFVSSSYQPIFYELIMFQKQDILIIIRKTYSSIMSSKLLSSLRYEFWIVLRLYPCQKIIVTKAKSAPSYWKLWIDPAQSRGNPTVNSRFIRPCATLSPWYYSNNVRSSSWTVCKRA